MTINGGGVPTPSAGHRAGSAGRISLVAGIAAIRRFHFRVARAPLENVDVPGAAGREEECGEGKQRRVVEAIEGGELQASADAVRFVLEAQAQTTPIGMASSSNDAGLFLSMIRRDVFSPPRGLCRTGRGMTA